MKLTFPLACNRMNGLSKNVMVREKTLRAEVKRKEDSSSVSEDTLCAPHSLSLSPAHTWLEETPSLGQC